MINVALGKTYVASAQRALLDAKLPHTVRFAPAPDGSEDPQLEFFLVGVKASTSIQIGADYFGVNTYENMDTDDFVMWTHYLGGSFARALKHALHQLATLKVGGAS